MIDELFDAGPPGDFDDPSTFEENPFHLVDPPASATVETPRFEPSTRRLAEFAVRKVEWLDKPFLQRAAFHLLAGRKGTCKGTWTCGLAARCTSGELYGEPKRVLVVTSEDSVEIDFLPRFLAASGNTELVTIVNSKFRLPANVEWLEQTAAAIGNVGLVVIDPIGNHLGGADTDKEGLVREAIGPLNGLSDRLDCLVIGVRHLSKDASRGALASILGSTAWGDVPRCVILMARDDEDDLVFHYQVVAGNRGPRSTARELRLELVDVPPAVEITRTIEHGASSKDVENLLGVGTSGEPGGSSRSSQARELILDILENDGEQESDSLDARIVDDTGLAIRSVKNVRYRLREDGLIKFWPDKDEHGAITRWLVGRTQAPRPE